VKRGWCTRKLCDVVPVRHILEVVEETLATP
jgi:hypothetical protein